MRLALIVLASCGSKNDYPQAFIRSIRDMDLTMLHPFQFWSIVLTVLVQGEGFEPSKAKPADLQSALVDRLSNPAYSMEPPVGFEPTTFSLQN